MKRTNVGKAAAVALLFMLGIDGAAQAQVVVHGSVFGAGKGTYPGVDVARVHGNTDVDISAGTVDNSVYGGGELGAVNGNTDVTIRGTAHVGGSNLTSYKGFVFGGGSGTIQDPAYANVKQNTHVTISGGYVHNTVFGGGELASVGTFTLAGSADAENDIVVGEPTSCADGTGRTLVEISAGQIGHKDATLRVDIGYVFGAGMGVYTDPHAATGPAPSADNARFGYVDSAEVRVSGSAFIVGAVWGGSENGQVLHSCGVHVSGGQIGNGWTGTAGTGVYTDANWTEAVDAVKAQDASRINAIAALMPECNHWEYGRDTTIDGTPTKHYLPYDRYAYETHATDASYNPGDGHTFFGNVFGGGSGYYPYATDNGGGNYTTQFYNFQGRVRGDTWVTITGGHVLTSVYGGCEYADVTGDCHVYMTGGTVGIPRTLEQIEEHPVICNLYGAGKGDQRTAFNMRTNVKDVYVKVSGGLVFGTVFGGGEDGHILGDAHVTVDSLAWIGTWGTSYYDGNVFGAGRGFGGTAFTAGSTVGNVFLNILNDTVSGATKSPTILGSVFGGGRLASVGSWLVDPSDTEHYSLLHEGSDYGNIKVNITGGTIGNPYEFTHGVFDDATAYAVGDVVVYQNSLWRFTTAHPAGAWNTAHVTDVVHTTGGNVFGSSMGRLLKIGETDETNPANFNHIWPGMAKCNSTDITISGNARIYSNVYGGGELGYVMHDSKVTVNGDEVIIGHAVGEGDTNVCYFGSVYGGGFGSDNFVEHLNDTLGFITDHITAAMHAGRVYGNATVTLSAGHVLANVYGGGELGSIGRRWMHMANEFDPAQPFKFQHPYNGSAPTHEYTVNGTTYTSYGYSPNVGNTLVTISGGTVGEVDPAKTVVGTHRSLGRTAGKVGSVFGGAKGRPGYHDEEGHHGFHHTRMAYVDSAKVVITGTAQIAASVFGGGENGHVRYGTNVSMDAGTVGLELTDDEKYTHPDGYNNVMIYFGNVYGGGRGIDVTDDGFLGEASGQVFGNTVVDISGGHVNHNVYGGGSIASVGTYVTQPIDPEEHNSDAGTGGATVTIRGTALIGDDGINNGQVYGSGRGIAYSGTDYAHKAFVDHTVVNINGGQVKGSVFGGGANGHVLNDTKVFVTGGTVGSQINQTDWTTPVSYTPVTEGAAAMVGTDWVKYPTETSDPQDYVSNLGTALMTHYHGNVYGGGRGVDRHVGALSSTAGRVYGNTNVDISGGTIYHNVYGGGSMASVGYYENASLGPDDAWKSGGTATVTIRGGQIGTTGHNNGHVFGSSRGMAGSTYSHFAFVNETYVNIQAGADIKGSVFGSGENGHVLHDTHVKMTGGQVGRDLTIKATLLPDGTELTTGEACTDQAGYDMVTIFRGNVYGGGRGVDRNDGQLSLTAGTVYGNTNVEISGGTVTHNVYGGGSMASVGTALFDNGAGGTSYIPVVSGTVKAADGITDSTTYYDVIGNPKAGTGTATVTIKPGATIGNAGTFVVDRRGFNNGRVFGAGRGMAGGDYAYRANVVNTIVTVEGGTVNGSVFGGGENGHVLQTTEVTVNGGTIGHNMNTSYANVESMFGADGDYTKVMKNRMANVGNVYGAGRGCDLDNNGGYSYSAGYVRGTTTVNIEGGTIHRNVYGGGSMALVGNYGLRGELDYIVTDGTDGEGNPIVNSGLATVNIHSSVGDPADNVHFGGNVFGSSRGRANDPNYPNSTNPYDFADMAYVFKTLVNVGNEAGDEDLTVYGNVYGGGEAGHVDWGGTTVNIMSGTVKGNVFGGGMGASTSPTAGIVDGNTQVNIGLETQSSNNVVIGTSGDENTGNVFGGNDAGSSPLGVMRVDVWHTGHDANNTCPDVTSLTDEQKANYMTESVAQADANYALKAVYGGGNKASTLTGDPAIDAPDWTDVSKLNKNYIEQRLNPSAYGNPAWDGDTSRLSKVVVHYCSENTIKYVYGGGRAANTLENDVLVEGGRIYMVFAGGDGHTQDALGNYLPANVKRSTAAGMTSTGNVKVAVQGGIVYDVFGGSNTSGIIEGNTSIDLTPDPSCELLNSETFAGGNEAVGNGGTIDLVCGTKFMNFYGGARNADINGDIVLNVRGGEYDTIFGGNKAGGVISGDVTVNFYGGQTKCLFGGSNKGGNILGTINVNVNIQPDPSCPDVRLDYVYGGGKDAFYTPTDPTLVSPRVNIINDEITTDVFGGGLGQTATVTACPKVTIGTDTASGGRTYAVTILGNVYGGGSAAPVVGNPTVQTLSQGDNSTDPGTTQCATTLNGNVYGGGLGATALTTGNTTVDIRGNRTTVEGNVYGGGNAGIVSGNTNVIIGDYE